jgi:hypothetical protein
MCLHITYHQPFDNRRATATIYLSVMTARPCAGQLLIRKIQLNNCEAEYIYIVINQNIFHRAKVL